jgi:hypothetical protein
MENAADQPQAYYYILSGIQLDFDSFDLGYGVKLSRTYVHLMSHPMLAFEPAPRGKHHPGPWEAVEARPGTTSIDLYAQLSVPCLPDDKKAHHDRASWIALLLRFATDITVTITLSSSDEFQKVRAGGVRARLLEPIRRPQEGTTVSLDMAEWIRDNWHRSLHLSRNETLMFALGSIYNSHRSSEELGLVSVWAALERLFSSNAAELKYRVCTKIAAYLEPPGEGRYIMFKYLTKLYDARSAAAHGSPVKRHSAYMDSATVASQAVLRIIELGQVPTTDDLEKELLSPTARND